LAFSFSSLFFDSFPSRGPSVFHGAVWQTFFQFLLLPVFSKVLKVMAIANVFVWAVWEEDEEGRLWQLWQLAWR
jgi:hypothetical protein